MSYVGLHYQPGFRFKENWPFIWQTVQDAKGTSLFVYLSDQVQELQQHIIEKRYPKGTTIIYRSTHRIYEFGDTAESWVNSENDFLRQKLGMVSSAPLAELFDLANNAGIELVWQVINEKGFSRDEMTTISKFELDRLALIRPMGGVLGAIGSSVSSFHHPDYVQTLEDTGLLAVCRTKDAWFIHHMGAYLTNLVLIGPNQYATITDGMPTTLQEKERIQAIFQMGYDEITVKRISSGELVAWRFGDLWMADLPQLHDVRFLISEFSLGDVDLNPNHTERSPGNGFIRGFNDTWNYLRFHLAEIHEVYPDFPSTIEGWIEAELNFGARLASEHKADMKMALWCAGQGATGIWTPYDIQPLPRWFAWSRHANTYEPPVPPKPPWSWKNLFFWQRWSSAFRVWFNLEKNN